MKDTASHEQAQPALYRVFSQHPEPASETLCHNAQKFFSATLRAASDVMVPDAMRHLAEPLLELRLDGAPELIGLFCLTAVPTSRHDLIAAQDAEAQGQAAGLGALAMRCHHVWLIHTSPDTHDALLFTMCAIAASVALGPVLPPDHSTLYGVLGASRRAAQALEKARSE